jgi:lipopolysaccharide heptosyltransferase I
MSEHSRSLSARRILIVRPSALGDVCRTVPLLATLRRAFPDSEIDWLVQDSFADAIASHPALSNVVAFPRTRFARWWRSPGVLHEIIKWMIAVKRRRYDIVYDFQGLGRSGAMAWFAGAPRRVGYRDAREFGWLGYNVRHAPARSKHTVDQMLELLEREGLDPVRDMRLYANPEAIRWWECEREILGIGGEPYVILAPTSRWESKQWPIERWNLLLEPLRARGFRWAVVIGGPGEESQLAGLARDSALINMVGRTTVAQTMAVIRSAGLVIANDSAPLHIAVGFDRPLIGLFGPTDPSFVGPYGRAESVIRIHDPARDAGINFRRSNRGTELLSRISVEMVIERIDAIVAPNRAARSNESESVPVAPQAAAS